MKMLNVELTNCHGIRSLDAKLDFGGRNAVAIYAPNGTMKTSFARTFKDFAKGEETVDHVFPDRASSRSITDENAQSPDPDDVAVVLSYDEELGPTESTSTLLVNPALRKEYEALQVSLLDARDALVVALAAQAGTKQDVIATVSRVFTQSEDKFFDALIRVEYEIEQLDDARFAELPHDLLFNDKVATALKGPGVQAQLADYVTRLNQLLDESTFFNRTSFSYYNATNVTKSLGANGFFQAQHSLLLHGEDEPRRITSDADLQALITEEKARISDDAALRKKLDGVERAVQRNEDTRKFFEFIASREDLLPEFANVENFHQDVWKSYLKAHEEAFKRVVECYKETEVRRKEIERQAATESTQWDNVIRIFNERFFVPFTLRAENKHRVALGQETMLKLVFEFNDGDESAGVERDELLSVLSNGEKKALYILNVLFEMEARKASGRETIFVIDDLADSFDYKNKYAIIQYLKEMSDHANFKLILLTHNFDFFRTLLSRGVVGYNKCFMAQKGEGKVTLAQASHVKNPFINGFKQNFFDNGMQRIASIPFVRNILEYTKGEDDPDYLTLTSLLHWKADSASIDNAELDRIFNETFQVSEKKSWKTGDRPVIDLLLEQAEAALVAAEGINFENKIVLSIATRMVAEKHMVEELSDLAFTDGITGNQTHALFRAFKSRAHGTADSLRALDDVVLMTPENIHVNSFMYEPIIDLSDTALRELYRRVKELAE
ncbi:coiled-coil domain-containing protein [Microbacterium resistens]|uniref:phage infection protein n=1 Tax=Microbacterium resistens TaxID=156977 RepID=UPI000833278D|nr:phage infection protein [Microbacterium resistens]